MTNHLNENIIVIHMNTTIIYVLHYRKQLCLSMSLQYFIAFFPKLLWCTFHNTCVIHVLGKNTI